MNDAITRLIAALALLAASFGTTIAAMVLGWGLEVKSWWAVAIFGWLVPMMIYACLGATKKN